jgi:hypothetical protein
MPLVIIKLLLGYQQGTTKHSKWGRGGVPGDDLFSLLCSKDLVQVIPYNLGSLGGINRLPNTLFLVIFDNGSGLLMEGS